MKTYTTKESALEYSKFEETRDYLFQYFWGSIISLQYSPKLKEGLYIFKEPLEQKNGKWQRVPTRNYITQEEKIEQLAKDYHEACREMVTHMQNTMITKPNVPYLEWDQLTDDQKNGRRFIAKELLTKYEMKRK